MFTLVEFTQYQWVSHLSSSLKLDLHVNFQQSSYCSISINFLWPYRITLPLIKIELQIHSFFYFGYLNKLQPMENTNVYIIVMCKTWSSDRIFYCHMISLILWCCQWSSYHNGYAADLPQANASRSNRSCFPPSPVFTKSAV